MKKLCKGVFKASSIFNRIWIITFLGEGQKSIKARNKHPSKCFMRRWVLVTRIPQGSQGCSGYMVSLSLGGFLGVSLASPVVGQPWLHRHPSKSSSLSWAPQPSTPLPWPPPSSSPASERKEKGAQEWHGRGSCTVTLGFLPEREIPALSFCYCPFQSFRGLCQLMGDTMSHSELMRPVRPGECH